MLQELIDLAESLYARGKNPYSAPDANGDFMEKHAVRLGILIEEVGKELRYMDSRCKEFYDAKVRLENRVKRLEAECLAIKNLH
jgi:hypothetical protein